MDGKLLEIQQELEGGEEENSSDKDAEDKLNFKSEMHKRASSSFYARQSSSVNLKALFYDTDPTKLKIRGRRFLRQDYGTDTRDRRQGPDMIAFFGDERAR